MYPALPPPRLQVLIATHRAPGIERVAAMRLPEVEGVQYLVSWQHCMDLPEPEYFSRRRDITVHRFFGEGVSANRNNLLEYATAPFVLIADDDLIYTREQLLGALEIMERHPDTDYFSFRYDGADNKTYPEAETSLENLPKGFYQTAFEVGLNRRGEARELRFNKFFGPGAPFFTAAEDEILLYTARRNGLRCRFFPFTICTHPGLTTGSRREVADGFYRSHGAVIALNNRRTWPLRVALNAWRSGRGRSAGLMHIWRLMHRGAVKALRADYI